MATLLESVDTHLAEIAKDTKPGATQSSGKLRSNPTALRAQKARPDKALALWASKAYALGIEGLERQDRELQGDGLPSKALGKLRAHREALKRAFEPIAGELAEAAKEAPVDAGDRLERLKPAIREHLAGGRDRGVVTRERSERHMPSMGLPAGKHQLKTMERSEAPLLLSEASQRKTSSSSSLLGGGGGSARGAVR